MEEDQQPLSRMVSVDSCSLNVGSMMFDTNRYNLAGVATAKSMSSYMTLEDPSNCDGTR